MGNGLLVSAANQLYQLAGVTPSIARSGTAIGTGAPDVTIAQLNFISRDVVIIGQGAVNTSQPANAQATTIISTNLNRRYVKIRNASPFTIWINYDSVPFQFSVGNLAIPFFYQRVNGADILDPNAVWENWVNPGNQLLAFANTLDIGAPVIVTEGMF